MSLMHTLDEPDEHIDLHHKYADPLRHKYVDAIHYKYTDPLHHK